MKKALGNKTILVVLLVTAFILAGIIVNSIPWRLDLSSGQFYTLSKGSRDLIKKVDQRDPIDITFYYASSLPGVPIMFKNYAERIRGLLEQYTAVSGGKIRLTVVDPKPDTPEEERAIRAGVQPQPLPTGENFFLGIVVTQAEQSQALPFFNPQREGLLEYDISQLIARVQRSSLPRLGIITSLPLLARPSPMTVRNPQMDWVVIEELRKSFDIEVIQEEIPDNVDVLAVIHPAGISPAMQYNIDQFILRGKPVFIAVDPSSVYTKQNPAGGPGMMFTGMNNTSDIPTLFSAYGILYDPQKVVIDSKNTAFVNAEPGSPPIPYPVWLDIKEFPSYSPATSSLNRVFFAESGAISLVEGSSLTFTPIITSSPFSRLIDQSLLQFSVPSEVIRMAEPSEGSKTLAAIITGKFTSAFPDGRPASTDESENKNPETKTQSDQTHLKESSGSSTLIVFADTDFLADAFSVQIFNFFGQRAIQPLNDNLAMAANVLELLGGSQDLITLRSKGQVARPFQRIIDMETKAQQEFQKQLEQLDNRLQIIRGELEALTREQRNQGILAISPEVQAKIDDFRAQEANVRAQRREIRKRLRENIENLNVVLAAFNLLAAPLALAGFGYWFFSNRAARQKNTIKEDTA
jgi:ABC-type uncharacterized transport system involved in gliding motility auxiliary subunit